MGLTAIEKVLARVCGKTQVIPGEIVYPNPDYIMIHDVLVRETKIQLDQVHIKKLAHPEKVMMFSDHDVIYGSQRAAERGKYNRQAAKEWGVTNFYDAGKGGHGHIFPMEQGIILPGMFYFDNDTHATNAGAVGAFGIRVGGEISRVLGTGTTWLTVPKTIRIDLQGHVNPGVLGRDIGFFIARSIKNGSLKADFDYRIIEFSGDLDQFSFGERVALCSSPTELRAAGVFIPPSERILKYCQAHHQSPFTPIFSDPDAQYESTHTIHLEEIEPQIALPGNLSNSVDISESLNIPVQHAFIGSCGSGTYEDLLLAAAVLKDKKIHPEVRLFIVPGSEASTRRMLREGLMEIFYDSGAMILPAGCGPCNDAVVGPIAPGENSISTATNNNRGRFGANDAKLYLGSPLSVAASAVCGKISDPRTLAINQDLLHQIESAYV